jgi:hypothetical protein
MSPYRSVLFLFFTLFFTLAALTCKSQAPQSKAGTKVTLDLGKNPGNLPAGAAAKPTYFGFVETGIPFEKKFTLHVNMAPSDTDVVAAEFSYNLHGVDCSKSCNALILPDFCGDSPQVQNFSNKGFDVAIRGVHPNRFYDFNFTFYRNMTADQRKTLKNAISATILGFIADPNTRYTGAYIQANLNPMIVADIQAIFNATPLFDGNAQALSINDLVTKILQSPFMSALLHNHIELADMHDNLTQQAAPVITAFTDPNIESILTDIVGKLKFNPVGTALYAAPLADTGIYKNTSLTLLLPVLMDLTNRDNAGQFFGGAYSLQNGVLVAQENNTDMASIAIILKALIQINRSLNNLTPNSDLPTNAQKVQLGTLITDIQTFETYCKRFNVADLQKPLNADVVATTLPDALVNFFTSTKVAIKESTMLDDIGTSNSAYISVDAGAGYAFGLSSAFTYFGVNFYLKPIDKTIHLSTYKPRPWLYILKTTSLTLGVTTNYFNSIPMSKRYVSLLGGGKDIFTGIGNRISRVLKINAGIDWNYLNDANPLSNHRSLNGEFVLTMSLDINVVKAFSGLANAIGLTN